MWEPVRRAGWLIVALAASAAAADEKFEIAGSLTPEVQASVTLRGALTPFSTSTLTDTRGRFRIERLEPGSYTLHVFAPGRGQMQRTIHVGPGAADERRRIVTHITLDGPALLPDSSAVVSARELAIPSRALREYERAERSLARRDVRAAITHLEKATEIAPRYSAAWNHLGTIAYQTSRYGDAEQYFRRALEADPDAFAPLVNLGGVLINLQRLEEALQYNLHAVLKQPSDALANSQLGMTYLMLGNSANAEKYLLNAVSLDPAHFSRPQLFLAELYLRRGDRAGAVRQLESFLSANPDSPEAATLRARIASLRE
jgi:Tfp pilus assembly protein PilF